MIIKWWKEHGGVAGYYNKQNYEIAKAINENIKLLSNDYVSKNSEIPTIGHMAYNRTYKDGKYIVNYMMSYTDLFYNILKNAFETKSAQDLISKNREKNESIKSNVENEIKNLEIINNEEVIQEDLRVEKENEKLENKSVEILYYIIIASFFIAILLCLITLVGINKKNNNK